MEQLATSDDVAKALNVTVTTVQRMTRDKKLPFIKVGSIIRYRLSEVMAQLESSRQEKAR